MESTDGNQIHPTLEKAWAFSGSHTLHPVKAVGASSEKVTMEFTSKMPLRLTFALPNAVKIEFYMAPRVED